MNAASPAATSGGSGRFSGCDVSLMLGRIVPSADIVVLRGALQRLLGNERSQRRIELREGPVEHAVIDMAAHASIAGWQRTALRVLRIEHVEGMALVLLGGLRRVDQVDLEVREIGLREAVLVDRALLLVAVVERQQEHRAGRV